MRRPGRLEILTTVLLALVIGCGVSLPASNPMRGWSLDAETTLRWLVGKFRFQHRLNEPAHPSPDPVLDPVEPIIEKQTLGGDSRLLRGIFRHGVVSVPARQRRNHLG